MKFIISIDGRICSGKSTIIQRLQEEFKKLYNIDVPNFSCGQHYRTNLRGKIPNEQVDDEMIKYMRAVYSNNDVAIIDGRSVSFAIKSGDILESDKPIISILLDIDKDVQLSRLLDRVKSNHPEPLKYALVRDESDEKRCFARYKKSIFDKKYYDFYLDTSHILVDDAVAYLMDSILNKDKMHKKTLLYAEETETQLGKKLRERDDINVIFLRFAEHLNFSQSYLLKSYAENVFVVSGDRSIDEEVMRFHGWLSKIGMMPDYFYNGSEFLQEKAHAFARQLGLGALSQEQVLWVRDKVEMKKKLRDSGIRVSDFKPLETFEDITGFASTYDYPIVIKRRKGQSCIDTYKVSNQTELNNLPIKHIAPNKLMVEKFNNGREWIIDGLIQDGKVLKTFVTYVPTSPLDAMTDKKLRGHIACNSVPVNFNFVPDDFIQQIVSSLNLRNGYIHLECFVDSAGKPTVGEFGWRPSGHRIIENHSFASGIDIYNAIIDVATGKTVNLPKTNQQSQFVGNAFLPKKSGVIADMMSKEDILAEPGIFEVELFSKPGDVYHLHRKSSETSGYAFVKGQTVKVVEDMMKQVFKKFSENMKIK